MKNKSFQYNKIFSFLTTPVNSSSLVFFRISFGLILFWEVTRYFYYGWIKTYWIDPQFFFTFEGFHWVHPIGGNGMYVYFLLVGVLALFIAIGLFYRASMILFFVGFSYIFLLDKSNYLNHFYFVILISFLLCFLNPHHYLSLDAALFPRIKSETIPRWMVLILQFQLGVVYFFGGVAKINVDWLRGEPIRSWLSMETDFPILGPYFTEDWLVYVFAYGGLLLDLLVAFFLIFKKTRPFAFLALLFFHLSNSRLFEIGIFPWMMIALSTIFFEPDWFKKLLTAINKNWWPSPDHPPKHFPKTHPLFIGILGVFIALQLLLPLRHFTIPGYVSWTEEGHRFSWHMKLRDKASEAVFIVKDPISQDSVRVRPIQYLTRRQARKMSTRPDMILQFAHYLGAVFKKEGFDNIAVFAEVQTQLNDRPVQLLINPSVNLLDVNKDTPIHDWVIPLNNYE